MKKLLQIIGALLVSSSNVYAAEAEQNSVYQINSIWQNQNGQSVQLKSFLGSSVVISMAYTSCSHSCPLTIAKLQNIEKKFLDKHKKGVKFVFVSFDAKKDRPAQLKRYMKARKLDEQQWTFLSPANDAQVRELAVVLGVSYKNLGNGDFSHSNVINLLDKTGAIADRLESLSADIDAFVEKIPNID